MRDSRALFRGFLPDFPEYRIISRISPFFLRRQFCIETYPLLHPLPLFGNVSEQALAGCGFVTSGSVLYRFIDKILSRFYFDKDFRDFPKNPENLFYTNPNK